MATTRKPRTPKTSEQYKQELEATKKRVAELEQLAYAQDLADAIKATNIADDFVKVLAKVKNVSEIAVLQAVAKAVGIKRVDISQAPPTTRKSSSTPRKPRAAKKSSVK